MIQLLNLSAQHLSALVTGILNYSTASNGRLSDPEPVALSDLLDEVVKLLSSPGHFEFRYAPDLPAISTSRTALTQIFLNLFSNAIKYCDQEKGWVEVHFSQTETHYQFEVSDNGPGIKEEDHQKIFELFQILGKKDRNNHLGTGIGLATVKKLVTELGGTIRVVSPDRRGTTFVFTHRK
jgi:signal transduction histidine kinase